MGTLDLLHAILVFIPTGVIPGSIAAILPLSSVPVTIILETMTCDLDIPKPTYKWYHYVGILMLFGGIYVIVSPGFRLERTRNIDTSCRELCINSVR
eukprot:UN29834